VTARAADETVPALVLGPRVTALGVVRALAASRIPTWVVADTADFTRWSRWYRGLSGGSVRWSDPDVLAEDLARLDLPRAVLFPCSDASSIAVAGLTKPLAERFPASAAPWTSQLVCTDKLKFSDALEHLGIPRPMTRRIDSVEDLAGIPEADFEDVFLKPRNSERFSADYRVKAFHCRGRREALESCERALAAGHSMVLQQYVPGPPDAHFFVDGFVDRDGNVRALFARQRLRMEPPDFGNSSFMRSVSLEAVEPALTGLRRFLAHIAYRGMFSAEFKRDPRDGAFKILELNARPWWYVGFARTCGVDVSRLAYLDALGEPVPEIDRYRVGLTCVYPRLDLRVYLRGRRNGGPSLVRVVRDWLGATQPVFTWSDPGPAVREMLGALRGLVGKRFGPPRGARG
jgi:predicted ATP-grasp superfamily ATP-dependent carboligase